MTKYQLYRPTVDERPDAAGVLAERPATLSGKTVGLLWNAKVNADVYLRRVQELLAERFDDVTFVWRQKPTASKPMEPEVLQALVHCDAVVTAFGD